MKIEIDTKQVALVAGGLMAGMAMSFGLTKWAIKKAKKDLKNEIIDKQTKVINEDIKNTIKENIDVKEIKNEIKQQIETSIIEDTLKEMNEKNVEFMAKVSVKLDDYEEKLDSIESNVLDTDARVGKLVNNAIRTIANVTMKRGDDNEN